VGGEAGLIVIDAEGPHRLGPQQPQFAVAHAPAPEAGARFVNRAEDRQEGTLMATRGETEGPLIIIGGHEDKEGDKVILKAVAERLGGGAWCWRRSPPTPGGYFESYKKAFGDLGSPISSSSMSRIAAKPMTTRSWPCSTARRGLLLRRRPASDQQPDRRHAGRGADPRDLAAGGVLAGTSAGASVMSDTMMVRGSSAETHRIGDLRMAPGLGLVRDVIIDQHFAERGRIGRLLGAVAQSPRVLGVGIDEDTAVVVEGDDFQVIGSGAVYVVDAEG
jgi:cyanophycinase